jgi:hypothetical protein
MADSVLRVAYLEHQSRGTTSIADIEADAALRARMEVVAAQRPPPATVDDGPSAQLVLW